MSTDKEPKFTSVDGMATHDSGGLGGWWNSLPPFQIGIKTPIYEPCNGSFVKAVASEFVHMAAFLFITIGHVVNSCHASNVGLGQAVSGGEVVQPTSCLLTDARTLSIATVFGLAIACLVYSSAVFSGGHLNPAVTIGFLVSKKITVQRAVCYWIAQMLGAILGSAFPYAIDRSGWNAAGGGVNSPLPGISDGAVWTLEALLTMALVFVVFAATDGPRAALGAHLPVLAPFAIGFTVFIAHLVAVPLDGCSINPARSFGPAVISGTWHKQWLFWVGPLCGGVFGALLYEIAFRPSRGDIGPTGEVTIKEPPPTVRLPGYSGAKGRQDRDVVPAGSDSEDLEAQAHHV